MVTGFLVYALPLQKSQGFSLDIFLLLSFALSQLPNGAALSGRTRPALVSNKNVAAAYASGIVALVINARNAVLVRIGPPFKDGLLYRRRVLATRFQISTAR